jgi:cytochrome c
MERKPGPACVKAPGNPDREFDAGSYPFGMQEAEGLAMKFLPVFILSLAATLASATAGFAQGSTGWSLIEAERVAGKQVFESHCAACHVVKPGVFAALGPSLRGVVGRPAASVAGFPYSDALKKSGLIWTEDNLQKWIADGSHMVPGMLMPHVSISDPAELVYIVAYLKSLKAPAKP